MPGPDRRSGPVVQEPQLGTAHALLQAEPVLRGATGTVVLLYGDVPLLEQDTLRGLIEHHRSTGAALTALTASVDRPKGYGRIIRDADGSFLRIVEERDATEEERAITEINAGVYAFELDGLFDSLRLIATGNSQAEYYLPDLVAIYRQQGRRVEAHELSGDPLQLLGVNSREELARMNAILRDKRNQAIMASGVTLDRSRHDLDWRRCGDWPGYGRSPQHLPRRRHPDRRQLRNSRRHPYRRFHVGRQRDHPELLRHPELDRRSRRDARSVRAYPARQRDWRSGPHREFRRAEEGEARHGHESGSSGLSRRCHDRRGCEHRRGRHHLQLRWREEAPDDHRRRRLRRHRLATGRAGDGRQGRVRRGRQLDHRKRAGRRARDRPRQAGEQRRLGGRPQESSARPSRSRSVRVGRRE